MARRTQKESVLESATTAAVARVVQLVGTPALFFLASTLYFNVQDLTKKTNELTTAVAVLGTASRDGYSISQARSDFALRDANLKDLQRRVETLEQVHLRGRQP